MRRWTTTHPIPIDPYFWKDADQKSVLTAPLGKDLLILVAGSISILRTRGPKKHYNMFIFRAGNNKLELVDCSILSTIAQDTHVKSIACKDDQLYLLIDDDSMFINILILYKLDLKTMELEKIIEVENSKWKGRAAIVGDCIYAKGGQNMSSINLRTLDVERFELKERRGVKTSLLEKHRKLYMLQRLRDARRVMIFEDRRWQLVRSDMDIYEKKVNGTPKSIRESDWLDGSVLDILQYDEQVALSSNTFDFENNRWIRNDVEQGRFSTLDTIEEMNKIGHTTFVISTRNSSMTLSLLEELPKLSTMCLLNYIDTVTSENVREKRKQISPIYRRAFDNMIQWRLPKEERSEEIIENRVSSHDQTYLYSQFGSQQHEYTPFISSPIHKILKQRHSVY